MIDSRTIKQKPENQNISILNFESEGQISFLNPEGYFSIIYRSGVAKVVPGVTWKASWLPKVPKIVLLLFFWGVFLDQLHFQ